MRFAAWFSIFVGILIFAQWGFTLASRQAPEIRSEPIRLAFHLAAEFATGTLLIVAGIGLLGGKPAARFLSVVALGMLLYTVIVSPGYFAQLGQWALVAMFAFLLLLAILALVLVWRASPEQPRL